MASQLPHAMVTPVSSVRHLVVGPLTGAVMATGCTATECVFVKAVDNGLVLSQLASTIKCSVDNNQLNVVSIFKLVLRKQQWVVY